MTRYVWESGFWYLPSFAFWAGVVTLAVRLPRRGQLDVVPEATKRSEAERTAG